MAPTTFRLGVDLGTSNTVAVLGWPDGRLRPLLFDGSPILPSAVFARSTGLLVGRDAVHSARTEPEAYEPTPKRRVDEGAVLLGAREVPVVELFAAVFRRVWMEAERTAGVLPPEMTLTCPASWGTRRRTVLVDAARLAGMPEPRLVAEPVAAAAYFMLGRQVAVPPGQCVVVYDFGGGTFDASVVRRTATGCDVLATEGLPDAGGLDIDSAVVGYLGAAYGPTDPSAWSRLAEPRTAEDRRARTQLWDDVRAAKEMLSRTTSTGVHLPLLGVDAVLGREQLDLLAGPVLERTVGATVAALRDAGVDASGLAGVFLVGGASRMPLAATMLHRALGVPPTGLDQPELAVAEGSLLTPDPGRATGGGPLWPAPPAGPVFAAGPPATAPVSAVPVSAGPAVPVSAGPASVPVSSPPVSAVPVSAVPVSASPVSGPPVPSGRPVVVGRPVAVGPPVPRPPVVVGPPVAPAPSTYRAAAYQPPAGRDDEPIALVPSHPGPSVRRHRPRAGLLAVVVAVLVLIVAVGAVTTVNLAAHNGPTGHGPGVAGNHDDGGGAAGVAAQPDHGQPSSTPTAPTATATATPTHSAPATHRTTPPATGPAQPPPGTPAPTRVHKAGTLQIPQTWLADLDELAVSSGAADMWFHAVTATERYVEPQGTVAIARVGQPANPAYACANTALSSARIPVANFAAGDVLCMRTDQGRLAVIRFNAPVGPSPGTLDWSVTTYEP